MQHFLYTIAFSHEQPQRAEQLENEALMVDYKCVQSLIRHNTSPEILNAFE